jgi:3-oxoacyl-[acyl-carrier-protein] synthase II
MKQKVKKRRVVITGIGAVTPLGHSFRNTWLGILEGVSVAGPVTRFDASKFPTTIAYEVKDFNFSKDLITKDEESFVNRAAEFGIAASAEAWEQAGLNGNVAAERVAVCLGVGMCSPDYSWYDQVVIPEKFSDPSLRNHISFFPDQVSSIIARMIGAKGGITTIHTACASSGQSLGEAYESVAYGDADVVLTGGCDSMIHPYYLAGFSLLGALSKRNNDHATASRPFDSARDGFVLGEGACSLVFEDYEHAKKRGAKIIAEVCGYGVSESAYRITDLNPDGSGPIEAMQMAIDDAGVKPGAIGYVNAHGTSTLLNDRIESLAINKVMYARGVGPYVSSTKSMTGHMISAAGAIELAICAQSVADQVLVPSINITEQDPECEITLTGKTVRDASFTHALSNSVGFGGSNTAVVVGRIDR